MALSDYVNLGGQSFRNYPVPNQLPALYTLSIRNPGYSAREYASYTFPLTPSMIRKDYNAMSRVYDVQGSPEQNGVQRLVDSYGLAPPIFTVEGTTGWQRHISDGFLLTGQESIRVLQTLLSRYASLNQTQVKSGNPELYTLEFYDYFSKQYWVVEPVGPQGFMQNRAQPLYTHFRFRWAAVQSVSAPIIGRISAALQVFGTPLERGIANAVTNLNGLMGLYSPTGEILSTTRNLL